MPISWFGLRFLTSSLREARIDREAAARIRRDADVVATGWFFSRQVTFGPRTIRVAATDLETALDQGVLLFKSPAHAAAAAQEALRRIAS